MRSSMLEWLLVIAVTISVLVIGKQVYQTLLVDLANTTATTLRQAGH